MTQIKSWQSVDSENCMDLFRTPNLSWVMPNWKFFWPTVKIFIFDQKKNSPIFPHLVFLIQVIFFGQMKKNQMDRTWQCHCEAIEIFFFENCQKIACLGPIQIWAPKICIFSDFQNENSNFEIWTFFSIAFFSAYIWSTKKIHTIFGI